MKKEYLPIVTTERIKTLADEKGITISQLNVICGFSKNTINQTGKGTEGMKARNLFAIAETLGCSVDYLLGRTNDPKENVVKSGDINGNNNSGNTGAVTIESNSHNAPEIDKFTAEFMKRFERLDFDDKLEIMNLTTQK